MSDTPADRPAGDWQGGGPARGYPARRPRNRVGVAALVVGVVALVLAVLLLFAPLAALLGLIAVILGIVGLGRANRGVADNRGQSIAGLLTGAVALIVGIALTISVGTFFSTHANDFREVSRCLDRAGTDQARATCVRQFGDRLNNR
jgi:hypothetical protein